MSTRSIVAVAACCIAAARLHAQPAAHAAQAAPAARVTADQFARLRWIEGTWRGTGVDQPPFYERYRMADDSTIVMESFEDSTLARVTSSARVELRDGRLSNVGEGAVWVASKLGPTHVTFAPVEGARNTFTWRRVSADAWTATLSWPGQPQGQRERVYRMGRVTTHAP